MKIKINNQLIAEACRASIKNLIKETEEFNNNQISRETLLQCMFQGTIYIAYNSITGYDVVVEYNEDLGDFIFEFTIQLEHEHYELTSIENVRISPIKVSGDVEMEIPMNPELHNKIYKMLVFELGDDYAKM